MDENSMHRRLVSLGSTLSRRTLGGLAAGVLLALGLENADAKKKKKKKGKKKKPAPNPKPICTPKCSGKTCGSDGCGGSCGSCGQGSTCSAQGQCVADQGYEFDVEWGGRGSGAGKLDFPIGIALDGAGNVYVVDGDNNRVQKFSDSGAYLTQWGAEGSGNGEFNAPRGIAIDSDGAIYVTDTGNRRVQKFRQNGANPLAYDFITKWGTEGEGNGQFTFPYAIAVDSNGNAFVTDQPEPGEPGRVQKFRPNASNALQYDYVTKWVTDSYYLGIDGSGNLYLERLRSGSDELAVIDKYSGTGSLLDTVEGDSEFGSVHGIVVDDAGNIFAVNGLPGHVQKFDSQGNYILTFADDQNLGDLSWSPAGIDVDADGNVYIADAYNHRIVKYRPTGASRAAAGRSGESRTGRRGRTRKQRAAHGRERQAEKRH